MSLVFVYGTLKTGHGNNRLLSSSKFLGEDSLHGFCLTGSGIPFAVPADGCVVRGEVYQVEDEVLNRLDSLEGWDEQKKRGWYQRKKAQTKKGLEVFFYEGPEGSGLRPEMRHTVSGNYRVFSY